MATEDKSRDESGYRGQSIRRVQSFPSSPALEKGVEHCFGLPHAALRLPASGIPGPEGRRRS